MAAAQTIKQEPEVSNIKFEPNEPGHLKITNVFSINATHCTDSSEDYFINSSTGYDEHLTNSKCSKFYALNSVLQAHLLTAKANNQNVEKALCEHKCPVCLKTFAKSLYLRRHMMTHDALKSFKCKLCSRTFAFARYLKLHMLTHKAVKPFKCNSCPRTFVRPIDLKRHEMQRHGKEKKFKCSQCPRSFVRNSSLRDHIRIHSNGKNFVCENCNATFTTVQSLSHHRPLCEGTSSKNKLPELEEPGRINGFNNPSVRRYIENMNQLNLLSPAEINVVNSKPVENQDIIKCDFCSTAFFSVESLEEHVVDIHVVDKEFKCTECTKIFICEDRLDSHMIEHEKEKTLALYCVKCPICLKTFSSEYLMNRHIGSHNAFKPYRCQLCSNSYARSVDLKIHEMNNHGKEKKYKCSQCFKSFARNAVLQDHIRSHSNERTIVCKVCKMYFKTKHGLRSHRYKNIQCKRTGSEELFPGNDDENNFTCHLCSKAFKHESSLRQHLNSKVPCNEKSRDISVNDNNPVGFMLPPVCPPSRGGILACADEHLIEKYIVDKEFKCPECIKTFISQERLDLHIQTAEHEKEEYDGRKCPICSKMFSTKWNLQVHIVSHDVVKPFKCQLCSNSYAQHKSLSTHEMNKHGKDKEFKCSKCPKSFTFNNALQDHIRSHSKDNLSKMH